MKKNYTPAPVTVTYVPHGINETIFYPIRVTDIEHKLKQITKDAEGKDVEVEVVKKDSELVTELKRDFYGGAEFDFSVLFVNRNIRRKLPGDVVLAFKTFCDMLSKEEADRCALVMHTQPIDENGTDLIAVVKELCPYKVVFSANRLEPNFMNLIHNIADVSINLASNEGFGLGTCEGLMAGTPTIVNVTGGLQDQCGFQLDGKFLTAKDYLEIQTLHDRDLWKNNDRLTWGEWAFPVWPSNRSLQGSPPTPYIFDDRPDYKEAALQLKAVYDLGKEERERRGLAGREFVTNPEIGMSASEMSRRLMHDIDSCLETWKPRKKFGLFTA